MSDNVAITAGTGTTMAADEVVDGTLGTVKVAFGKIMDGTLDGTNKLAITAGNAAKVDGSATTQPVSGTFWQATQPISGTVTTNASAATSGGYTPGKLISAASTNATNVKASAGTIGYITASSINAAARYLKIYDKASAPTVGTDIPVHVFLIPGNTAGTGTNIPLPPQGILCSSGISFAITTGVADADTGAVAANELVVNYGTK